MKVGRVAIVGSRHLSASKKRFIKNLIEILRWFAGLDNFELEFGTGDCPTGADALVREVCEELGVPCQVFKADRSRYAELGNRIYYQRNRKLVEWANEVWILVEKGYSGKGSRMVAELCFELDKPFHWLVLEDLEGTPDE